MKLDFTDQEESLDGVDENPEGVYFSRILDEYQNNRCRTLSEFSGRQASGPARHIRTNALESDQPNGRLRDRSMMCSDRGLIVAFD